MTRVFNVEHPNLEIVAAQLASEMAQINESLAENGWYPVHTSQSMMTRMHFVSILVIVTYSREEIFITEA